VRTFKLFIVALVSCLTIPAAAQLTDAYVIPAAGKANGNNGTRWLTQLSLFNPHFDYPLTVSLTYLPGNPQLDGIERLIELPPNSTYVTDDLLGDVFETNGTGSVLAATFAEDNPGVGTDEVDMAFLINTNTYNDASSGTYGQTIPGVFRGLLDYQDSEITAVAHGIDNSTRLGFRTNVGATNLGRCSVTMLVSAYDADGRKVLDEAPFILPPLGPFQGALPVQIEGGTIEFLVEDPCRASDDDYAVVFPYVSTIDNLSGDPRYQSPTLLATPGTVFGKKASTQKVADTTQLGKRIDTEYVRGIRSKATRLGKAHLVRGERGWVLTR
jgi:hypothetical protein